MPPEILAVPDKPALPGPSNQDRARYVIEAEGWMDAARDQIGALAGMICAMTGGCDAAG